MKATNGIDSWIDTFFEISTAIGLVGTFPALPERLYQAQRRGGHFELKDLAVYLTDKFERQNTGRKWDGEFIYEINDFIAKEFNKFDDDE